MTPIRRGLAAVVIAGSAALALAGDVVVLKGGAVIPLKQPWVRRGNTAYLTKADGTLLSVPVSEIDRDATAAAQRRAPASAAPADAPGSTPAEIARSTKDTPKARVRITDADVSHPLELPDTGADKADKKDSGVPDAKVEVADYTQEKNGGALAVKGTLRNVGQAIAESVRISVSAIDEKGQTIDGSSATLSKNVIASGQQVDFVASLNVGDRIVATLRFNPVWTSPKPTPAPSGTGSKAAPVAAAAAAARAPAPQPTPYGLGNLYAPPPANAPSQPPADGKTGYIPGASHPDNQPKPPTP